MSPLVHLALIGWLPVVFLMFSLLRPRVAVAASFAAGWCFLPVAGYSFPGLPDYNKQTATTFAVLLATAVFHSRLLARFQPRWIDLPMAVWCAAPMMSSLRNGLGAYDGASAVLGTVAMWGAPYFLGRVYFTRLGHLKDLAFPIIAFALIYVPLCLYEVRMSPQLHTQVYGFHQHVFAQTKRFGGWRPTVFMNHGLQVALWMMSGLVLAWSTGIIGRVRRMPLFGTKVPHIAVIASLLVTLMLAKSVGAWFLAAGGIAAMHASRIMRSSLPVACITCACVAYMVTRGTGIWSGENLIDLMRTLVNDVKAGSLRYRFDNENILVDKALQRPLFGWGGWGRSRVYDDAGNDISVTDGLWVIAIGQRGLLGLTSLYTAMLLGPTMLVWRCSPKFWSRFPSTAVGAGLAVAALLSVADSLLNAMMVPVMTLAIGAMSGVAVGAHDFPTRRPGRAIASR